MKRSQTEVKAERLIHNQINEQIVQYRQCTVAKDDLQNASNAVTKWEINNSELVEAGNDSRETSRMVLLVVIVFLSIFVDYILSYHALTILCLITGWPRIIKVIIPIGLVILEIIISATSYGSMHMYDGQVSNSKINKYLPYVVIVFTVGLSLFVISYSLYSFKNTDDVLPGFSIGTIVSQIFLLIASVMLHLWIIRHSVEICEMFAYERFKLKCNRLMRRQKATRNRLNRYGKKFTSSARSLVRNIQTFHIEHPNSKVNFVSTMPVDLVIAIRVVMGKDVFGNEDDNPKITS